MDLVLAVLSIDLPKIRRTVGLCQQFVIAFAESRSPGFHTSIILNYAFCTCPTFREVDVYQRGKTRGKIVLVTPYVLANIIKSLPEPGSWQLRQVPISCISHLF